MVRKRRKKLINPKRIFNFNIFSKPGNPVFGQQGKFRVGLLNSKIAIRACLQEKFMRF